LQPSDGLSGFSSKGQTTGNGGTQNNRPTAKATAAVLPKGETKMFLKFQYIVFESWSAWSGLFEPLPYGDPYIATIVLFSLVAAAAKFFVGGETG